MNILIDLDCLLDARLGTLALVDPQAVTDAIQNGFQFRIVDDFTKFCPTLDNAAFEEAYKKRTVESLLYARPTSFYSELHLHISELLRLQNQSDPTIKDVQLIINLHPYQLTPHELEQIKMAIYARVEQFPQIKTVSLPAQYALPWDLKLQGVTHYFCYGFTPWINAFLKGLEAKDKPIASYHPEITICAPGLTVNQGVLDEFTKKVEEEERLKGEDPFKLIQELFEPMIGIQFFDAHLFSLYTELDNPDIELDP